MIKKLELAETPFFSQLPGPVIDNFEKYGWLTECNPRSAVYYPKDEANLIYYVRDGLVRVALGLGKNEDYTLQFIPAGRFFGTEGFISDKNRDTLTETFTDTSLYVFKGTELDWLIYENSTLSQKIIEDYHYLKEGITDNLLYLNDSAARRLCNTLDTLLEHCAEDNILSFSHSEIARFASLARPTVSKLLKQFASDGILELKREQIIIYDREKLRAELS